MGRGVRGTWGRRPGRTHPKMYFSRSFPLLGDERMGECFPLLFPLLFPLSTFLPFLC